jgi:hypothetical protein
MSKHIVLLGRVALVASFLATLASAADLGRAPVAGYWRTTHLCPRPRRTLFIRQTVP